MNILVSFNNRFRNSVTRSFRQCFVRLFLLISCNSPNSTALLTVLSPLSWVETCFPGSSSAQLPSNAAQLCFLNSAVSHFDIETSRAFYPSTLQLPLIPRAVLRLQTRLPSAPPTPFLHIRATHVLLHRGQQPGKTQLSEPHTSHLSIKHTSSCAALPWYLSMQEPAPNPGAHAPNTWEQPQPLSTAMLSHTAWPTRRSGARNHTGDVISTGAGLLREIKLEGKPQFPTTRGVGAHDNHRLRLARNQPAHPGHSPGTEEAPGEPDLHTEF